MSELRQNLATKEWVIIAPERLKGEPLQSSANPLMDSFPAYEYECPFCPRNIDRYETVELDSIPNPDPANPAKSKWLAQCIENRYNIFSEGPASTPGSVEFDREGIYRRLAGHGNHELVIESPEHNKAFATMTVEEITAVVKLYLKRFDLLRDSNNLLTVIFKNSGPRSGASQRHPHSQIVGMKVVPNYIRFLLEEAQRYFDSNGICVFCKMIDFELQEGKRIVYQNKGFVSYVPYAAFVPYEIRIFPREHDALLGDMAEGEVIDFADCLQKTMRKLYLALSNPDFNLIFRNPPYALSGVPFYHWHLQVVPHIRHPGGFELGSRVNVNVVLPEEAAGNLRRIEV